MDGRGELRIILDDEEHEPAAGSSSQKIRFARLRVIDTGCGMDKETLDRAFEPFFTTKPVGQGTGLGLSVIYGLIREMRGTIAIGSEPGRGTTVTILIPGQIGKTNDGINSDSRRHFSRASIPEGCVAE
jgi:signal transduction histidine kinase